MTTSIASRLGRASRELKLFAIASLAMGMAYSIVDATFNYGFSRALLPEDVAFLAICGFYLLDQMLFSVGMARSMYMKKIAREPGDVQAALTAGVTIDHIFSISVALLGGAIWSAFGFQYVFLMGVVIAALSFFAAQRVRLPAPSLALSATPAR